MKVKDYNSLYNLFELEISKGVFNREVGGKILDILCKYHFECNKIGAKYEIDGLERINRNVGRMLKGEQENQLSDFTEPLNQWTNDFLLLLEYKEKQILKAKLTLVEEKAAVIISKYIRGILSQTLVFSDFLFDVSQVGDGSELEFILQQSNIE